MNNIRKTALVTGGTSGIGQAIAYRLANAGYNVAISGLCRNQEADETLKVLKEKGSDSKLYCIDFSKRNTVKELFIQFDQDYSTLNVLVNNAGWTQYIDHQKLEDITEEFFDKIININLKSVYFCSSEASKRMQGDNNCIVNIASIAAFNGIGSNIAYCASKAGVVSITKSLARVLGNRIRVNAVAPGLTETNMTKTGPDIYRNEQIKITPMGRIADPDDIADAAYSLIEISKFVNGQTLIVDGGRLIQ
jgi:3-oxoacyl-[acyl-carrier protein] reductase